MAGLSILFALWCVGKEVSDRPTVADEGLVLNSSLFST